MSKRIRWGILSTAGIALTKFIPALKASSLCEVTTIASRDLENANQAALMLYLPKHYGDYDQLLNDPDIDVIYNALPNHLHVEWTIKALQAGKHVLCEKPIGLNAADAQLLLDTTKQFPHLKVMEGFMYKFHPQWQHVKKMIKAGAIGDVQTVNSIFTYNNTDARNIRNIAEAGGGGLLDIGCYCVSFPRFLFDEDPISVIGQMIYDEKTNIDKLTSGMMQFSNGKTSTFTCATQAMPFQQVHILGTKGHINIEIPVNQPPSQPTILHLRKARISETITIAEANQYSLLADAFAKSIIDDTPVPVSLEDAINNMKVLDYIKESSEKGISIRLDQ